MTTGTALARPGAADVALIREIIPPFERDDGQVLAGLRQPAGHWRAAFCDHDGG